MATDFLGQEYGPGDWVIGTKGYGCSSVRQILAEVVSVNDTTVVGKVLRGSRSKYEPKMMVDVRTGRQVYGGKIHIKKPAYYTLKSTGREITSQERYIKNPAFLGYSITPNVPYYLHKPEDVEYHPDEYWEYVQQRPANVVFYVKDNVVKVNKDTINLEA
jgi:hypothetical protein